MKEIFLVTLLAMEDSSPMSDKWEVVRIPALNTTESLEKLEKARKKLVKQGYLSQNYTNLELGESFWPEADVENGFCWSTEEIIRTKNNTPPFKFDALYGQAPSAEEGNIIKLDWWQNWDNPSPLIANTLYNHGIRHFLQEVQPIIVR